MQFRENLHTCRYLVAKHDGVSFRVGVFAWVLHIFYAAIHTDFAKISKKQKVDFVSPLGL